MSLKILPAIFCFFLCGISAQDVIYRNVSYGKACSPTRRCDPKSYLRCQSGTCHCYRPDIMVFQPDVQTCGTKVREQCKFLQENLRGESSYELTSCVTSAECDQEGFCACLPFYTDTANGTCMPSVLQNFSQPCNSKLKCGFGLGLECHGGSCLCTNGTIYSPKRQQCVGLPGAPCILGKCSENASCGVKSECACYLDFYQNPERQCQKKVRLGKFCEKDFECSSENLALPLKCVHGTCECDPLNSLYGKSNINGASRINGSSQCLGKANYPCITGFCAEGAKCSPNGICTCLDGYAPTESGTCGLKFGGKCNRTARCHDGFVCKNRQCSCRYEDMQIYVEDAKLCLSKVGGPCNESNFQCQGNAICKKGMCHCGEMYQVDSNGGCLGGIGAPCDDRANCSVTAGLACVDNSCQCDSYSMYDRYFQRCLRLVGARCSVASSKDQCAVVKKYGQMAHHELTNYEPSRKHFWGYTEEHRPYSGDKCIRDDENWERECLRHAYCRPIQGDWGECACEDKYEMTLPGHTCERHPEPEFLPFPSIFRREWAE